MVEFLLKALETIKASLLWMDSNSNLTHMSSLANLMAKLQWEDLNLAKTRMLAILKAKTRCHSNLEEILTLAILEAK